MTAPAASGAPYGAFADRSGDPCGAHPAITLTGWFTCPLCAQERRRAAYAQQRQGAWRHPITRPLPLSCDDRLVPIPGVQNQPVGD